jgi:membrane protein DedA with SNARE-associated domain
MSGEADTSLGAETGAPERGPERDTRPGRPAPRWWPWAGRPRARDLICAAGLVLSGVWGVVTIPLTPMLIATRPVLLELLTGSTPAIVAAGSFADVGNKLQLTVVVAAALPGLMTFDLFYWWAGVLWGPRIVRWLMARYAGGKHDRHWVATVRAVEQRGPRFAGPAVMLAAFLPVVPAPLIYAAAGWVGLGPLAFLLSDVVGSTAWAVVLAVFGYQLGPSGVAAANLVSRYALLAIVVLLAAVAAPHAWRAVRAWRARSRLRAGSAPEPDTSGQLP